MDFEKMARAMSAAEAKTHLGKPWSPDLCGGLFIRPWPEFLPHVDALLSVLEAPNDAMVQAACDYTFGPTPLTPEEAHMVGRTAMVKAIRGGA